MSLLQFYESVGLVKPDKKDYKRQRRKMYYKSIQKQMDWYYNKFGPPRSQTAMDFVSSPDTCFWCEAVLTEPLNSETKRTFSLDHIWPIAAGGSDTFENIVKCCHKCNQIKLVMDPITFGIKVHVNQKYRVKRKHGKNIYFKIRRCDRVE